MSKLKLVVHSSLFVPNEGSAPLLRVLNYGLTRIFSSIVLEQQQPGGQEHHHNADD